MFQQYVQYAQLQRQSTDMKYFQKMRNRLHLTQIIHNNPPSPPSCIILKQCLLQICIHRMLQDVHVIRFYAQRTEGNKQYLFIEYASGGELFDRIGKIEFCPCHPKISIFLDQSLYFIKKQSKESKDLTDLFFIQRTRHWHATAIGTKIFQATPCWCGG